MSQEKNYEGTRDKGLYIRLSEDEKTLISEGAKILGLSQSDFIMKLVRQTQAKKTISGKFPVIRKKV